MWYCIGFRCALPVEDAMWVSRLSVHALLQRFNVILTAFSSIMPSPFFESSITCFALMQVQ